MALARAFLWELLQLHNLLPFPVYQTLSAAFGAKTVGTAAMLKAYPVALVVAVVFHKVVYSFKLLLTTVVQT